MGRYICPWRGCQVCVLQGQSGSLGYGRSSTKVRHVIRLFFFVLSLLLAVPALADEPAALADEPAALVVALRLIAAQDWAGARAAIQAEGPVARDIIEWHRLRAGQGEAADFLAFVGRRQDWPGLPLLLAKGEAAVAMREPKLVLTYFAGRLPATGAGALALALAYRSLGQDDKAEAEAVRAWRELSLSEVEQAGFLAGFGPLLAGEHTGRLDAMLWAGQPEDARRMLALVPEGWQRSGAARLGLLAGSDGVDALLAAVPADFAKGAGLAYARFVWRLAHGRQGEAADLLLERSSSAARLGRPDAWAEARSRLARQAMREGKAERAYRLAADHFLAPEGRAADYADLEWLAGYIALQKLGDADLALQHFQKLRQVARSEISLGRAGYWEGRAFEALGQSARAQAAYEFGAKHQTGFYGLLAAEKAGQPMDAALAGTDHYPDWRSAPFLKYPVLQAGLLLQKAGARPLAARFFAQLAETLSAEELGQLADLAQSLGEPYIALVVAKRAAEQGVILYRAYYPVTEVAKQVLAVPTELALAIARRESEFNPGAVSAVGARGLMQLMPGTAKLVAPKLGLAYDYGKLTADPGYNVRLGSAYLAQLRTEFGPSPLLVAAGYNAGPGRPRGWIEAFGDPRQTGIDPVDWIEAVPFAETRTYIMRVTESMLIYRARLAGKPVPIRLMAEMKGR